MRTLAKTLGVSVALLLLAGAVPAFATGFSLGDAANFAVLYEGTGGNALMNNGSSNITGNIGIGGTGTWDASGPGTITGIVEFSAAQSGAFPGTQFKTSNTTYVPAVSAGVNPLYSQSTVSTALSTVNSLNSSLGSESGKAITINVGNGGTQTINASSGMVDGSGNEVFTVSSVHFVNGATLDIQGTASQYVVLNITANGPQFGGGIDLTGGITSDHVLFNIVGSNNTLQISANCDPMQTTCYETGTFLDPNGTISENHSVLDGRLFGGDSSNMSIVSGGNVTAPMTAPEASSLTLAGLVLLAFGAAVVRARRHELA